MGLLRDWLFKALYPVPQKREDLLAHKQIFIEEYTRPHQLKTAIKMSFLTEEERDFVQKRNIKSWKDHEQLARLKAQKIWRKIACARERS